MLRVSMLIAVVGLVLVSCGDDSNPGATSATTATAPAEPTATTSTVRATTTHRAAEDHREDSRHGEVQDGRLHAQQRGRGERHQGNRSLLRRGGLVRSCRRSSHERRRAAGSRRRGLPLRAHSKRGRALAQVVLRVQERCQEGHLRAQLTARSSADWVRFDQECAFNRQERRSDRARGRRGAFPQARAEIRRRRRW